MSPEIIQAGRVPIPAYLRGALHDGGFVPNGRAYRNGDLTFTMNGRWLELIEQPNRLREQSLCLGLGQPGLWKWVHNGAAPHRVFEIPLWAVSDQPEDNRQDESGHTAFAAMLAWALATRLGQVPPGWQSPAAEVVKGWLSRGALTVQARGCLRQGELSLSPNRWALRVPILSRLAEDLPESRRRALAQLAAEAQRHWAMVRLGISTDANPAALLAEVDFTGAPHCELLFSAGLDVLRHVVAWLAETADVLGDPSIGITSLADGGDRNISSIERSIP